MEVDCQELAHFEAALQSALGKEGTGMGTGSVIGGKGAPDKINMEGMGRSWRQSFDGFDVEDGVGSSEDNGRSQGIEGDGGFHGVGGCGSHMRVCFY